MINKFRKIREGMFELGVFKDGDVKTLLICNFNNGELVFNNLNRENAGTWIDRVKISDIGKECCKPVVKFENEKWYKLWKLFLGSGIATDDYNVMVEKLNSGEII